MNLILGVSYTNQHHVQVFIEGLLMQRSNGWPVCPWVRRCKLNNLDKPNENANVKIEFECASNASQTAHGKVRWTRLSSELTSYQSTSWAWQCTASSHWSWFFLLRRRIWWRWRWKGDCRVGSLRIEGHLGARLGWRIRSRLSLSLWRHAAQKKSARSII